MNVAHPLRGIIPTLDAPVIETLAATTRPLTGREVNRIAGVGSARGVQVVLRRLAAQGLVLVEERSNAGFYAANREHLAWQALESLARLRIALRTRLSEAIGPGQSSRSMPRCSGARRAATATARAISICC